MRILRARSTAAATAEAKATAAALSALALIPELIAGKSGTRTLQTAEIFVRELHLRGAPAAAEEALYLAGAETIPEGRSGASASASGT